MKAARWYSAKDIRVEEVTEPKPAAGQVKIKVKWAGICGSDLHEYVAGPIFVPVKAPHPVSHDVAPIIMGHEFSGEVSEVGEGVERVKPGDRVVVEPILACGKCDACFHGKYNLCDNLGFHGLSGGGGGFAGYTTVGERWVHKMPEGLSFEQGALVEPAAVALHAVRISSLKAGGTAAVFGAGPIGLLVVEALKVAGASAIHVVELSPQRGAKAIELGATSIIDPSKENAAQRIRELTPGGVDVTFEVTGVPAVLQQCIDATRYEGETVIVSIWEKEAPFQPNTVVLKEKSLKGTIAYRDVFPAVMNLMVQGYFSAEKLVTKRIELDDIVAQGFDTLVAEKSQIKILVRSPD
ncbi:MULTISPECIES: 2,3-butanediol dehydrogenase [Rhizobiaceae]|jgi:(R,R)-butanediol dehydrogenase/meso-butanediol dehydrogenase/diacetyl reductase|uniref:(R,R)-butanediol dehydrogenase/meso-butanediol dehydrogenase/diacetyl reductase n=1 Tax=Aliirhizobium cellulosilyticum TaxID=393664 RepID=A0A7W6UW10_9HYPH|nr:2,3-butanediol dehydrogenase [Rhizobium cellulosilyticum]MBB4346885.1 (R,R)-butanediol dehydrogenase/meso-butanediol dehydrogenase/diacetyl reductase [Rhizobium cellulosilyticum]MBB4410721.1 (R,R)-butanediol dehydrogenase/meso-butanediol dehydrogenase/diacetyl reductase [Rhizobium cellulosilyticum]MBB4445409.1 (R,R)-butanediol dehydrogenase/meso-butanediol dehydrogenase/diacetyl reductase [Rhizobium cellulosilyticum]